MTFYPTSIDTFSLSRTVFEIFGYRGLEDIIRVYSLPFFVYDVTNEYFCIQKILHFTRIPEIQEWSL